MNYCAGCIGCAIQVLLDKVQEESERSGIDEPWYLLASASELVDDLVAQARMLEVDQSSSEKEMMVESMPVVGNC
jgi:hypothetical protein